MVTTATGNAYKRWFACLKAKIVKDLSFVVFWRYQGKTLKSFFRFATSRRSEGQKWSGQPSKSWRNFSHCLHVAKTWDIASSISHGQSFEFSILSSHFVRHSFQRIWKNIVFEESCNGLFLKGFDWKDDHARCSHQSLRTPTVYITAFSKEKAMLCSKNSWVFSQQRFYVLPVAAPSWRAVNLRNRTGKKPCVTSVTIILFEKNFFQNSPFFKQIV